MILTGPEISRQVELGRIDILPFCKSQINPNSYDFRLGETLLIYRNRELDSRYSNETQQLTIPRSGLMLESDRVYLGHTAEYFATNAYVPMFFAKSSIARLGLFVHVTANLIDIGHRGQWTLQLHAVQPVVIYPHMRIGQATFWVPTGKIRLYEGKYQDSRGPLASKGLPHEQG